MSTWKVWDKEQTYGDLFFKRATGELPEMESSKALAKVIEPYLEEGDKIGYWLWWWTLFEKLR